MHLHTHTRNEQTHTHARTHTWLGLVPLFTQRHLVRSSDGVVAPPLEMAPPQRGGTLGGEDGGREPGVGDDHTTGWR